MRKLGKIIYLVELFAFYLLFFVLENATVKGLIFPFAFGMLFALSWCNQKVWIVAPAYILAAISRACTFENAISAITVCIALALPYYIHVFLRKNIRKWELGIYGLISQTSTIVFSILGGISPVLIVASVLIGLLFLYASIIALEPIFVRGLTNKLTLLELLCAGVILLAFSNGLDGIYFFNFSLVKLFATFVILALAYMSKGTMVVAIAGILGIGTLIGSNNPLLIAPFVLWAIASVAARNKYKFVSALAVIAVELMIGFYFELYYGYGILELAPVLLGSFIFEVIPKKYYEMCSVLLSTSNDRLAIKNVVNRNREILQKRIGNLSEVFCEMNDVFKRLIKKEMSKEEVAEMLYEEIKSDICKNCSEQKHCHRTFSSETKAMFKELITIALERGRITLLDLPSYLTSRCNKANALISQINTLTKQYKSYSTLVGNVDTSKLLISDQLSGVSQIMKSLANEVDTLISFNTALEDKIKEQLSYENIVCQDAVVFDKDARTVMASLIVRESDANREKIPHVLSQVCGSKMNVYEITPSSKRGLVNVNLKTAPRYDAVFGLSTCNKTGSNYSGDCHSIEKLDGDKFLFAICDGMGSGKDANQKSDTAIGLIENFYKAGFDNDLILSSVNKLLNLEKDDIFSTIDICVLDLKSGIADMIKMGASSSFIRGEEECKIIEGGALPIGVLDNVQALTKKVVLNELDFIVLCSDGIADGFGSDGELKDFLLTIKTTNPQEFADELLNKSLANNNGQAVDDMTCIVIKIFANR